MSRSSSRSSKKGFEVESIKVFLTKDGLGWKNLDGIILKCVNLDDSKTIIKEMNLGLCGGHYAPRTTTTKIMWTGFYWCTLFKDVHHFVRSCQESEFFSRKPRLPTLPLKLILVEDPFQQWGMDFIGPFDQNSSNGFKYILTCTDYLLVGLNPSLQKGLPSKS